jgi:PAS domain S-box-containing protein
MEAKRRKKDATSQMADHAKTTSKKDAGSSSLTKFDDDDVEAMPNLLQIAIDNALDHIYVKDRESRFLLCGKALARIMGAENENEIIGKTDFYFYPKELAEKYYADEQRIIKSGKPLINYEEQGIDAEGMKKYYLTTKVPLKRKDGAIIGILGIGRDITNFKLTEEALDRERNLLRMLIDNLPDHIYAKDINSRFILANKAVALHMGAEKPEDLIGKTDFDSYPKELAEKFYNEEQGLIRSGQSILDHEEQNRDSNGKAICTLTTKVVLRNSLGQATGIIGIGRDISERKDAQARLEEAYKELNENQQKLLISEKQASLGKITAGIAHEMNSPLAVIRASLVELKALVEEYMESVSISQVSPEDHQEIAKDMMKNINIAVRAAEKSAGFLRGIKYQTYSEKEQVVQIIHPSPFIEDALMLLEFRFRKNRCSLKTDLDENVRIPGDPRDLSRIITNLVNNSIDACNPGSGVIVVSFMKSPDDTAILRVEDNGSGILPENLSKIFDPMFTTKPFGEGIGLGLSIVYDLVKKARGKIEVESRPGKTVFSISFPLAG